MSITHHKEAHFFTVTLDIDQQEVLDLHCKAAALVTVKLKNVKGNGSIVDSTMGTWLEELAMRLFQKSAEYAWLEQHGADYSLVDARSRDIHDGMVHIKLMGNKDAAMFKLAFGGQPSAIAA